MILTAEQKLKLATLAHSVIHGILEESLPEEIIAERYSRMYAAALAFGSDLVNICQMYDRAENREDGAGLVLMLNYGPQTNGTIPEDLPEGSSVIHATFGVGEVHVNKTVRTNSPANSMWGHGDDFRMIAIEFFDGVHWMNPDEEYLYVTPPAEKQVAA
jgi:hypothetical protein